MHKLGHALSTLVNKAVANLATTASCAVPASYCEPGFTQKLIMLLQHLQFTSSKCWYLLCIVVTSQVPTVYSGHLSGTYCVQWSPHRYLLCIVVTSQVPTGIVVTSQVPTGIVVTSQVPNVYSAGADPGVVRWVRTNHPSSS